MSVVNMKIPEGQAKPWEPANMEKNSVQMIMAYDLCGLRQSDICDRVQMTQSRVSVIMNSPLYKKVRNDRMKALMSQVEDKKSSQIVNDPIQAIIDEGALKGAKWKLEALDQEKNSFVRNAIATDFLDRKGYVSEKKKSRISIEVTEKMADRFAKVLAMNEGETKATMTVEVTQ